jgi:hypothetical protein
METMQNMMMLEQDLAQSKRQNDLIKKQLEEMTETMEKLAGKKGKKK